MPVYKANYDKLEGFLPEGFIWEFQEDKSQAGSEIQVELTQKEADRLVGLMNACEMKPDLLPEIAWYFKQAESMASAANRGSNHINDRIRQQKQIEAQYEASGDARLSGLMDVEQIKLAVKDYNQLLLLGSNATIPNRIRVDFESGKSIDIKSEDVLKYIQAIIRQTLAKHDHVEFIKNSNNEISEIIDHTLFHNLESQLQMTEEGKNPQGVSQSYSYLQRKEFANCLYKFLIWKSAILDYGLFRFIAQLMIEAGFVFPVQQQEPTYTYDIDPDSFAKNIRDLITQEIKADRAYLNKARS